MRQDVKDSLYEIGRQLDSNAFPSVADGGIVLPGNPTIHCEISGKEKQHAESRSRRSEAEPGTGAAGWQGSPGGASSSRAWAPGASAPFVGADLPSQYADELDALRKAYPGTQVWHAPEGIWIIVKSSLLQESGQQANFLIGISFASGAVRAWGFWGGEAIGFPWIGPRHTNFLDGSICAFEPADGTWVMGDSLISLVDLFTVWALRHLYHNVFGRWPGPQSVHRPYERLLELRDDELCGGCASGKTYGECCKSADLRVRRTHGAVDYACATLGIRQPPPSVVRFMVERKELPNLSMLI